MFKRNCDLILMASHGRHGLVKLPHSNAAQDVSTHTQIPVLALLHLKDWGKTEGYKVLFGEGETPWAKLLDLAASKGGAECFLIEQEGSRYPSLETSQKCLESYRKLRGKG